MKSATPRTDELVDGILPTKYPLCGNNDEWFLRQTETVSFCRKLERELADSHKQGVLDGIKKAAESIVELNDGHTCWAERHILTLATKIESGEVEV